MPEFLEEATLDHVDPEGGRVDPDMPEGDHGELVAPVHGDTDAEAECEEFVPAALRECVCVGGGGGGTRVIEMD